MTYEHKDGYGSLFKRKFRYDYSGDICIANQIVEAKATIHPATGTESQVLGCIVVGVKIEGSYHVAVLDYGQILPAKEGSKAYAYAKLSDGGCIFFFLKTDNLADDSKPHWGLSYLPANEEGQKAAGVTKEENPIPF